MWNDRWLAGLERVVVGLFVVMLVGTLVRWVGWEPGWVVVVWQVSGVAFVLAVLMYLNVGGGGRVARSTIGSASLALLGLALLTELVTTVFDLDSPAWDVVGNVAAAGFVVCFAGYVAVRHRRRAV